MGCAWGISVSRSIALSSAATILAGCNPDAELFKPVHPNTHAEAGTVHLAVAPPIPFRDVERALSPRFALTGDGAFDAALPTTSYSEDHLLQAISVALGVGLPKTSVTGAVSDGTAPDAKAPDRKLLDSSRTPLATSDNKRPLAQDPILQYSAATALFQEVRLLERYVSYAAQRHGYKPFVLRLNIGLHPFARHQPYDAYATIGFFSTDTRPEAVDSLQQSTDTCDPPSGAEETTKRQPYILPLLVTDNLAGTSSARSAEMITQVALAVSVLAQGLAGNASFGSTREHMRSILATDMNALLTVSRSVDNAIQVRLGAATHTVAQYAMIPRNHTITVLMLVPDEQFPTMRQKDPPNVRVMMKTSLRESLTGKELLFDSAILVHEVIPGLKRAGMDDMAISIVTANELRILKALVSFVQAQNGRAFQDCLEQVRQTMRTMRATAEAKKHKRLEPDAKDYEKTKLQSIFNDSVWIVLAEIQSRSNYQTASVALCNPDVGPYGPFPCRKPPDPPPALPRAPPKAPPKAN